MRWVKSHTSRASLPFTMFSIPRHIWPEVHALLTLPFSTSHSMRRWPSILVIGSMTILFDIVQILLPRKLCVLSLRQHGECLDDIQVGHDLEGNDAEGDHGLPERGEIVPI